MSTSHGPLTVIAGAIATALVAVGCGTTAPSHDSVGTLGRGTTAPSRVVRAASGHAPVPAKASVGSRALCQEAPAVRAIAVQRVNAYPQHHIRFTIPARATITSHNSIQAVARTLCALPPQTIANCPFDFGIGYDLTFYPARLKLTPVTIAATGCGSVTGLGHPVRAVTTQRFWRVLGSAMRLAGGPAAVVKLLQGSLPWIAG